MAHISSFISIRQIKTACLAAFAACFANAAFANCEPEPHQVSVFQHSHYGGICSTLNIGEYRNAAALRIPNDSISSIRVGSRVQFRACEHAHGHVDSHLPFTDAPEARCQLFTGDISDLNGSRIGNDTISSAKVERRARPPVTHTGNCSPGDDPYAVAIYRHSDLQGTCKILRLGSYPNSSQLGFRNDSISSIEFHPDSNVTLLACQHSNFGGRCETFSHTTLNLHSSEVGNDEISSIQVRRR